MLEIQNGLERHVWMEVYLSQSNTVSATLAAEKADAWVEEYRKREKKDQSGNIDLYNNFKVIDEPKYFNPNETIMPEDIIKIEGSNPVRYHNKKTGETWELVPVGSTPNFSA